MTMQALGDYLLGTPKEQRQKEADYLESAIKKNPLLYKKLGPVIKKLGQQLNMPYLSEMLEPTPMTEFLAEQERKTAEEMGYKGTEQLEGEDLERTLLGRTLAEKGVTATPAGPKGVGQQPTGTRMEVGPTGDQPLLRPRFEAPLPARGAPGSEAEPTLYGRYRGLDPIQQRLVGKDISTFLREGEQFDVERGLEQAALQVEQLKLQSQISKWIADLAGEGKKFELDAAKAYGDAMAPIFAKTLSPTKGKAADVDMAFVSNLATIILGAPDAFRRQQHLPAPVYDSSTGKIVWGTVGDILIESAVPGVRQQLGPPGGK